MLEHFLEKFSDDAVDEILVNGIDSLWLQRGSDSIHQSSPFTTQTEMTDWLQDFAAKQNIRLDPLWPANGGVLKDTPFRWHALLQPIAHNGPVFCLRRHRFKKIALEDFQDPLGLLYEVLDHAHARRPLIICGSTASGKTSFLAALVLRCCHAERVLCVEQIEELPPLTPHWLKLIERTPNQEGVGAYSLAEILRQALRLRPDRMILGEVRGIEAEVFLQLIDTGHGGVLTTLHAGNLNQAIRRLETLSNKTSLRELFQDENVGLVFLNEDRHRSSRAFLLFRLPKNR